VHGSAVGQASVTALPSSQFSPLAPSMIESPQ
jgi:hypothetical protein